MARYREELRNRFLTLLPALLLTSLLFFLPEIWAGIQPLVDDAYTQAIMTVAPEAFDPGYRFWTGLGLASVVGLYFLKQWKPWQHLMAAGMVVAATVAFGLFPTYGEVQQGPTKEAALLARQEGWDVVMWRLDMPSFAFYYGDITPLREPEVGEVVFTRVTRLERLEIPTEVLFQKGGIVLARALEGGRAEMVPKETGPFVRAPDWMVFGPLALALVLLIGVEIGGFDRPLFFFFNSLSSYTGPTFWANATILGDGLVCGVLLLPWIRRNPERVWGGLLGAVFMVVILHVFKEFLGLPRPLAVLPEEMVTVIGPGLRRGAFPSGHTATMALFAGIWALSTSRRLFHWMALTLAVLVGVSRMAVGVHWPTDVLGGFALGWVSAWIGLRWAARASWGMGSTGRRILTAALLISGLVLLIIDHTGYPGVLLLQRSIALVCLVWGVVGVVRPSPEELSPEHVHTGL